MRPDNPWLRVPLADYEGHMAHVGQAALLDAVFADALADHRPRTVAVLGAAGGNGFARLAAGPVERAVAVDINPGYLEVLQDRYAPQIPGLEIVCGDICGAGVDFAPVEYVHAALILEYVDPVEALARIRHWLVPDGRLGVLIQLPGGAHVSPSPYSSLSSLAGDMRLYEESELLELATTAGFARTARQIHELPGGKRFCALRFRIGAPGPKE